MRAIDPGAEDEEGTRLYDSKEIIIGDIVTAIDGEPVYKMSGDVTHHLRTTVDLGPIGSIVMMDLQDKDGFVFQVA